MMLLVSQRTVYLLVLCFLGSSRCSDVSRNSGAGHLPSPQTQRPSLEFPSPATATTPTITITNIPSKINPSNNNAATQASYWSSYMTVDPSSILSLLIQKAGFFLDPQLLQLSRLMHCDQAQLNVVQRQLVITNFTVSIPTTSITANDQQPYPYALRIGKIHVGWDSYSRPCMEIQVENVDIVVEFTNILLTRNNWNELHDLGFPPPVLYYQRNDNTTQDASKVSDSANEESYDYIRIGSLDFQGEVVLHTRSRPLRQAIADDVVVSLRALSELNQRVKSLSDQNAIQLKRKGCTSDEIYDIVQSFFTSKLKQAIQFAIQDLAKQARANADNESATTSDGSRLIHESKKVVSSAKETLRAYANSVGYLSKETIKDRLRVTGEDGDVLVDDEQLDRIVSGTFDSLKKSVKSLGVKALQHIDRIRRQTSDNGDGDDLDIDNKDAPIADIGEDTKAETIVLEQEFFFPDW